MRENEVKRLNYSNPFCRKMSPADVEKPDRLKTKQLLYPSTRCIYEFTVITDWDTIFEGSSKCSAGETYTLQCSLKCSFIFFRPRPVVD